jgi:hypothetical protein
MHLSLLHRFHLDHKLFAPFCVHGAQAAALQPLHGGGSSLAFTDD